MKPNLRMKPSEEGELSDKVGDRKFIPPTLNEVLLTEYGCQAFGFDNPHDTVPYRKLPSGEDLMYLFSKIKIPPVTEEEAKEIKRMIDERKKKRKQY